MEESHRVQQEQLAKHLQEYATNIKATLPVQGEVEMPLASELPEQSANKQRKAEGGTAVPGAPSNLSEQQQQQQEQLQEQQQKQEQEELRAAAEKHLQGLNAAACCCQSLG